jgi:DNA polymerase/3'-5' exonuclease PolX
MLLQQAQQIATEIIQHLKPHCEHIVIAGSVRRQEKICKDVEIVCIPKKCKAVFNEQVNLFGEIETTVQYTGLDRNFIKALSDYPIDKGSPRGRHCKINYVGAYADVFICTQSNFGYIYALRTGPKALSQRLVVYLKQNGYVCNDGWVYKNGTPIEITQESELFTMAGLKFYDPQFRK